MTSVGFFTGVEFIEVSLMILAWLPATLQSRGDARSLWLYSAITDPPPYYNIPLGDCITLRFIILWLDL